MRLLPLDVMALPGLLAVVPVSEIVRFVTKLVL